MEPLLLFVLLCGAHSLNIKEFGLLPNASAFFHLSKDALRAEILDSTYRIRDGCDISVRDSEECRYFLLVTGTCLSPTVLVQRLFGANTLALTLINSFKNAYISGFALDRCEKTAMITAINNDVVEFVSGFSLNSRSSFTLDYKHSLKRLSLSLEGDFQFAGQSYSVSANPDENGTYTLQGNLTSRVATVSSLLGSGASPSLVDESVVNQAVGAVNLGGINLNHAQIDARLNPSNAYLVRLTLSLNFPALGNPKVFATFTKTKTQGTWKSTFDLAGLAPTTINLAKAINATSGLDIGIVPLLGSLSVANFAFLYSSSDISVPLLPQPESVIAGMVPIKRGFQFQFDVTIGEDTNTIAIHFASLKEVVAKFRRGSGIQLGSFLGGLKNLTTAIDFPTGLKPSSVLDWRIADFFLDGQSKAFEVRVQAPSVEHDQTAITANLSAGFVLLPGFNFTLGYKPSIRKFSLSLEGDLQLAGQTYRVRASRDDNGTYTLHGNLTSTVANVSSLLGSGGGLVDHSTVNQVIAKFQLDAVSLNHVHIDVRLSPSKVYAVRLTLDINIPGLENLKLFATFTKTMTPDSTSSTLDLAGMVPTTINLVKAVKAITRLDISKVPLFASMSVANFTFLYSSNDISSPAIPPTESAIASMVPIKKGFQLQFGTTIGGDTNTLAIYFTSLKEVAATIPRGNGIRLGSFLRDLKNKISAINFPNGLDPAAVLDWSITDFLLDGEGKAFQVHVQAPSVKHDQTAITANLGDGFVLLPGFSFTLGYNPDIEKFFLFLEGDLRLAGQTYRVSASRDDNGTYTLHGSLTSTVANVSSLLGGGGGLVNSSTVNQVMANVQLGAFSLKDAQIDVRLSPSKVFAVRLILDINYPALGNPKLFATFTKTKALDSWTYTLDLAGMVPVTISLGEAVKAITRLDISKVSLFPSMLVANFTFLYSSNDISSPAIPSTESCIASMVPIKKGFQLQFDTTIGDNTNTLAIHFTSLKEVAAKIPRGNGIRLGSFLGDLKNKISAIKFPAGLDPSTVLDWSITDFLLDGEGKAFQVRVQAPSVKKDQTAITANLSAGFVLLPGFSFTLGYKPDIQKFSLSLEGDLQLAGQTYRVRASRDDNGTYTLHGSLTSTVASVSSLLGGGGGLVDHSTVNQVMANVQLGAISLNHVQIDGRLSPGKVFAVRLTLDIDYPALGNPKLFGTFTKAKAQDSSSTTFDLAGMVPVTINLTETVKAITRLDIGIVPLFASMSVANFTFLYSSNDVSSPALPPTKSAIARMLPIKKGFQLQFDIAVGGSKNTLAIHFASLKEVVAKIIRGNGIQLGSFLGNLRNKISSINFPTGLDPAAVLDWSITDFVLDGEGRAFQVHVKAPSVKHDQSAITANLGAGFVFLPGFSFTLGYKPDIQKFFLSLEGDLQFAGQTYRVSASRDENSTYTLHGSLTSTAANVSSLLGGGGGLVDHSTVNQVMANVQLGAISLNHVQIDGRLSPGKVSAVRLTLGINFPALGNPKLFATFTKAKAQNIWTSTLDLAGMAPITINLAEAVKAITRIDIGIVPLFASISVANFIFIYSSNDVSSPAIPQTEGAIASMAPIKKGFQLQFDITVGDDTNTLAIHFTSLKEIVARIPRGNGIQLGSFLGNLGNKISAINFPGGLNPAAVLKWRITDFLLDGESKEFQVRVQSPSDFTVIPSALVFKDLMIIVDSVPTSDSRAMEVTMTATWKVGNINVPLAITKPNGVGVFIASAHPDVSIPFGSLIENFLVSLVPPPLEGLILNAGLSSFSIEQPSVHVYLGAEKALNLAGTAVVGEWDNSRVEVIMGQVEGAKAMASAIRLGKIKLTRVIRTVSAGKVDISGLPGISLLDNTEIAIIMSSQYIPKNSLAMRFTSDSLYDVQISDGVELVGIFAYPDPCDDVCAITKKILGEDNTFIIKGALALPSFRLAVMLPTTINIIEGAAIKDVGFEVEVGPSKNAIAITGSLELSELDLTFKGAFGFSQSGGFLEMSAIGVWSKPFGLPFLEIGNLHFSITIFPDPALISAIEFGGNVSIGRIGAPDVNPIRAAAYIGIDRINPLSNYLYARINVVTISSIIRAFVGTPIPLPKPIAEIGFPKGVKVSFAAATKTLPGGVTIPRGFFLVGTVKVMFFEVDASISLDLNGLLADLSVSAFNLGNGLVSVSGRDARTGPRLFVDLRWNPPRAVIDIMGRVSVLGISASTNITIDTKGFHFAVSGKMLSLFRASLQVSAAYENPKTAAFQVAGSFEQELFSELQQKVQNALNNLKEEADRAINSAIGEVNSVNKDIDAAVKKVNELKGKVRDAQGKFDAANKKLDDAKKWLDSKHRDFDNAVNALNNKKRDVDNAQRKFDDAVLSLKKKEGSCPSACRRKRSLGFKVSEKKAKSILYSRRKRGWGWNPVKAIEDAREFAVRVAKERAREVACVAKWTARQACLGVLKVLQAAVSATKHSLSVVKAALSVAAGVVDKSRVVLDAAKLAVTAAQKIVDGAKHSLNIFIGLLTAAEKIVESSRALLKIAELALEAVRAVKNFGIAIGQAITKFALGGLIDVQKLSFDVSLAAAETGHFRASITVRFLGGSPKTLSFTVNLKSVPDMVASLVNMIKSSMGIKKRSVVDFRYPALAALAADREDMRRETRSTDNSCHLMNDMYNLAKGIAADARPLIGSYHNLTKYEEEMKSTGLDTESIDVFNLIEEMMGDTERAILESIRGELWLAEAETGTTSLDQIKALLVDQVDLQQDECARNTTALLEQLSRKAGEDSPLANGLETLLVQLEQTVDICQPTQC